MICNYDTVMERVVVNKVHSFSRSEALQFETTPRFLSMGWKHTVVTFGYEILQPVAKNNKLILVRAFLFEVNEKMEVANGIQDAIVILNEGYLCYMSQTDRGLTLL